VHETSTDPASLELVGLTTFGLRRRSVEWPDKAGGYTHLCTVVAADLAALQTYVRSPAHDALKAACGAENLVADPVIFDCCPFGGDESAATSP